MEQVQGNVVFALIKIINLVILAFACSLSWAEPGHIGISVIHNSAKGGTYFKTLEKDNREMATTKSLQFSSGLRDDWYRFRLGLNSISRNLEDYTITSQDGDESSLADSFDGNESQVALGADLLFYRLTLAADILETVTNSPLATRTQFLAVIYSHYGGGHNIKYEFQQIENKQPISYTTHPESLTSLASPAISTRKIHQFSVDQIINENLKVQMALKYAQENVERPGHYGLKTQFFVGITDSLGMAFGFERIQELKNKIPQSGGGYYDLNHYQFGLSYELNYNILLKTMLSTTIETESSRGTFLPEQKVGTDFLSLGVEGQFRRFLPSLLLSYGESNTKRREWHISGGLKWEL